MEEKVGLASEHAKIVVTVTNAAPTCAGRTFDVNAVPDPLTFKLAEHPNAFTIHWKVDTAGYSFPPGTTVPDPTPPGQIEKCTAGGTAMSCVNKSTAAGKWKYTIPPLVDRDGCSTQAKDPIISNE